MKHILLVVLVAMMTLGALAPATHAAQGIYGTWWNPKDTDGDGYGFGFRSQIRVNPYISFDTRASWLKFKDDNFDVFPVEATAMLKLGMMYAGAGGGYYIFNNANLQNNFGWYALGGIDVPAGPVGLFGEVRWLDLSTDPDKPNPDAGNVGTRLKANGLNFNIGVMFEPKI